MERSITRLIENLPIYEKAKSRDSHYWKTGVPTNTEIFDAWHCFIISGTQFRDLLRYCDPYS